MVRKLQYVRCFLQSQLSFFSYRYKLAFSQSRFASYLFDGTGYALINNIERRSKFGMVTRFDIAVRTIATDGIIFLMVNGVRVTTSGGRTFPRIRSDQISLSCSCFLFQEKFFLLELKNGFLRLIYDFGFTNGTKLLENNSPKLQINDARYHEVHTTWSIEYWLAKFSFECVYMLMWILLSQVSVIYHQFKKVILLVDKRLVKSVENPKITLPFSDIYIGGAPSSILKSRWGQGKRRK